MSIAAPSMIYKASPSLEAFILASAPAHYATPDAPSTFEALRAAADACEASGSPLPVWDGGCDRTIYSRPEVNHAFRAWHDKLHLQHGAAFDATGEMALACAHVEAARRAGLSERDCFALFADVWGQFVYAFHHGGDFPNDQAAFVAACFSIGIDRAAKLTF